MTHLAPGDEVFHAARARDRQCANTPLSRDLGADEVIDYCTVKFEDDVLRLTEGRGADAAFDTVGGDTTPRNIRCVRTGVSNAAA